MLLTVLACNRSRGKTDTVKRPAMNESTMMLAVIPEGHEAVEIVFSPDGRRVAYSAKKDGKFIVVFDNKAGKPYAGVADLAFGPDSRTFAYRAVDAEGRMCMVVDGREGRWSENMGKPAFSPDGRTVGYEAMREEKYVIVVGDKESPAFDMPYAPPLFNKDSTRIAYIEQHYDKMKNNVVIGNADMTELKKGKDYDLLTNIMLSQDRSVIAYVAKKNGKKIVVTIDFIKKELEEREGPLYDEVVGPALAPDGKHTAYIAKRSSKMFLVRDGVEHPYPADGAAMQPLFSQDGSRIVSVGILGTQMSVILDGKTGPMYEEIGRPAFSPDGALIAYPARKDKLWFIVVNGKEGPAAYDMIVTPQFSPDGLRVVYRARKGGKRFIVTADRDGRTVREQPPYEMVWQPAFTNGKRSIAYGVKSGRELWWKVEPIE
jgi:Tol biopolymer transport system component